jgi:hypothetical protein
MTQKLETLKTMALAVAKGAEEYGVFKLFFVVCDC